MNIKVILVSIFLFLVMLTHAFAIPGDEQGEGQVLYNEAKKMCIYQKWTDAINIFEELLHKYPSSRYTDDAKFWLGYSLEKVPGKQMDSFQAYTSLIESFPNSPWVDDAAVHQISLAEQFIKEGNEQFRSFLLQRLKSSIPEVRHRSAIALGKIGDKKSLPVLRELTENENYSNIASALIKVLRSGETFGATRSETDLPKNIHNVYSKQSNKDEPPKEVVSRIGETKRYVQYRSMLKKGNKWSRQELFDFALWHIIPTDRFEEYISFTDEYDKTEWLRKYWKSKDPTPTTDKNEIKDEFERRIKYARSHFSEFWEYYDFGFLQDQHMRFDWFHAPWDARGELYIKYGEPDFRSVHDLHAEEWIYYRYNVDFIVKQYMTNIYGNAINPGSMSYKLHKNLENADSYLQAHFISNNEIKYEHDYKAVPISDFQCQINQFPSDTERNAAFIYIIPVDEFKLIKTNDKNKLQYLQRYVIFDEDFRAVMKDEKTLEFPDIQDRGDKLRGDIEIYLKPGAYRIALRIEDINSNKLCIHLRDFIVRN